MDYIKKNLKYVGILGCIMMVVGNFLPFAKVTVSLFGFSQSQSVKFIDGHGVAVLIAAIIAGILIYIDKHKLSLIPTGIGAVITIYNMIDVKSIVGETMGIGKIGFGIGAWIIVLGAFLAIGAVVFEMIKSKETTEKGL